MSLGTPATGTQVITFGMVPVVDDADTRMRQVDLCALLGQGSGIVVRCHRFPSPDSMASAYARGRVQLAWGSPTLLVLSPALENAIPLVVSVRNGRTAYHAGLFVREASDIRGPEDLGGRRAAWVSATSAAGYIFPRLALRARGLDPDLLFGEQDFLHSYGAVTHAVHDGAAHVGASFVVFEDGDPSRAVMHAAYQDVEGTGPFRIILAEGPIPSDAIVASPSLSPRTREKIVTAFERLGGSAEAEPLVRALFGADSFQRVAPDHFHALRERLRTESQPPAPR